MLFTSIEFLFLFLPLTLAVYYLLPFRWNLKNYWLLAASLGFYAWGEPKFVFAMLASIAFNYVAALVVERLRLCNRPVAAKGALACAVAGNLALIGVWKYANFVTATLRDWFPSWQGAIPQTSFLLPIGISFFTFQALSYVIDVHRGVKAQRNPLLLALYIALFPQLIAGPIVRYTTVCGQISSRKTSWDQFTKGVFRFVVGFNKKMLLANVMAEVADKAFALKDLWCREMVVPFCCAVLGCAPWWRRLVRPATFAVACCAQFVLLLVSVSCLVMKAHNPFIYFNACREYCEKMGGDWRHSTKCQNVILLKPTC